MKFGDRINIINTKRTTADGNFEFLILGCGYKLINDSKNIQIENKIFVELLGFSFFRNRKSILQNSSEKQANYD